MSFTHLLRRTRNAPDCYRYTQVIRYRFAVVRSCCPQADRRSENAVFIGIFGDMYEGRNYVRA
jgi:hypothetical protein